jgi:hypothetical protein
MGQITSIENGTKKAKTASLSLRLLAERAARPSVNLHTDDFHGDIR